MITHPAAQDMGPEHLVPGPARLERLVAERVGGGPERTRQVAESLAAQTEHARDRGGHLTHHGPHRPADHVIQRCPDAAQGRIEESGGILDARSRLIPKKGGRLAASPCFSSRSQGADPMAMLARP